MRKHLVLLMLLFLGIFKTVQAQDQVTGKVTDEKGAALSGISVKEKGTRRGVSTSQDGTFSIKVKKGTKLIISGVGYSEKELIASDN